MGGNIGDSRVVNGDVVFDTTCSKGKKSLGEGDDKGESLECKWVDDVDGANMV